MSNCEYHTLATLQALTFAGCGLVTMQGCRVEQLFPSSQGQFEAVDSRVVLVDCELIGFPAGLGLGSPAMALQNTKLEIAGASTITGGSPVLLVDSASQVCIGPIASIVGPLPAPPIASTVSAMSAQISVSGVMDLQVHGAPGGIAVQSFGSPAVLPVPLWGDSYFLNPATVTVFDFVLLDAVGAGAWQGTLAATVPSGLDLWLQSAILDPGFEFQLTTPAVVISP